MMAAGGHGADIWNISKPLIGIENILKPPAPKAIRGFTMVFHRNFLTWYHVQTCDLKKATRIPEPPKNYGVPIYFDYDAWQWIFVMPMDHRVEEYHTFFPI